MSYTADETPTAVDPQEEEAAREEASSMWDMLRGEAPLPADDESDDVSFQEPEAGYSDPLDDVHWGSLDLHVDDVLNFFRLPSPLRTPQNLASSGISSLTPRMRSYLTNLPSGSPGTWTRGAEAASGTSADEEHSWKRRKTRKSRYFSFEEDPSSKGASSTATGAKGENSDGAAGSVPQPTGSQAADSSGGL